MSPTADAVLKSALSLSDADRIEIADALLSSLPEDVEETDEDAFLRELQRRSDEMDQDPTASVPWDEVKKQLARP